MSTTPSNSYVGRDATDCRDAYDQSSIVLTVVEDLDGISFGQDASDYSYDGPLRRPPFRRHSRQRAANVPPTCPTTIGEPTPRIATELIATVMSD